MTHVHEVLTEGVKNDAEKPRYELVPPRALEELVKVLTHGARKYDADNWRRVLKGPEGKRRYFGAMMRHGWAWLRGETHDPESGLHHLAHAACSALFIAEVES